ncbi:MAG TPA: HEAT repeat domain-containing protein [Planctomycetota bacterium]|nr:HEAT repeat domain-containing protein [Planctomycetota bacterium]
MTRISSSSGKVAGFLAAALVTTALAAAELPKQPEKLTAAQAVDACLPVAEDPDETPVRRNYAVAQIVRRGKDAVPRIIEIYPAADFDRRGILADVLAGIRDPGTDAAKLLLDDLRRSGLKVHPNVIRALGELNVVEAAEPLVKLMPETTDEMRRVTLAALARLADARAADALLSGLKSPDRLLRMTCADALTRLLAGIRPKKQVMSRDDTPFRSVLDRTLEYVRSGEHVDARRFLITGMSRIDDPAVSRVLVHTLRDREDSLRAAAAGALGTLKARDAVDDLTRLVDASDDAVRRAALRALGEIGDASCVGQLIDRLDDAEAGRRRDIVLALRQITGERFGDNPEQWRRWYAQHGT